MVHFELAGQSYPIVNPLSVKILLYQKILQLVLLKFPLKQLLWTHIHHLRSQKQMSRHQIVELIWNSMPHPQFVIPINVIDDFLYAPLPFQHLQSFHRAYPLNLRRIVASTQYTKVYVLLVSQL